MKISEERKKLDELTERLIDAVIVASSKLGLVIDGFSHKEKNIETAQEWLEDVLKDIPTKDNRDKIRKYKIDL